MPVSINLGMTLSALETRDWHVSEKGASLCSLHLDICAPRASSTSGSAGITL